MMISAIIFLQFVWTLSSIINDKEKQIGSFEFYKSNVQKHLYCHYNNIDLKRKITQFICSKSMQILTDYFKTKRQCIV